MGGVNKCDQFLSYYSTGYKSMKWWKCIFYCLLELRIANALVIYFHKNPEVKKKKKQSHELFHEMLVHEIVQP